jgi:MYXO-CTERM domain-containing protein
MLPVLASHRGFLVALSLGAGVALAGCGDAGPSGPGERTATAQADLFANDVTACNYFVGKGLSNFQAAGIVGNLDQESGVSPTAVQSGGPGRGIAQWSVGGRWDTDANDNAEWYATQQGQSVDALTLQLDFIWYELTTFSGYGLASLKASTNVTDATVDFETDFEGCGQCDQSTRISYAEGVLPSCEASAAPAPYAAQFVSQSFPLATTTLTMIAGQVIPSYIELKNTGAKSWDSSTRIGTTQPRDRVSVFADGTWEADNRPAAVTGTVAPGATYKFTFDLAAPDKPGSYDEFFGVVEDGVAWFSDPGQGGPPDTDLEVKITVVAGDGGTVEDDAGKDDAGKDDAGKDDAGGSAGDDAGASMGDGGGIAHPGSSSGSSSGGGAGDGDSGTVNAASPGSSGGCSVVATSAGDGALPGGGLALLLLLGAVARRRLTRSPA